MLRTPLCTAALILAAPAFAETEVSGSDIPEAVAETATETAPGVTFTKVGTETEEGRTVYEFEGKSHDGKHIKVDVFDDGTLQEIEMEIGFEDLPAPVKSSMNARFPGFRATYVESSVHSNGVFLYEIEGVTADGAAITVEIAEDGTVNSAGAEAEPNTARGF